MNVTNAQTLKNGTTEQDSLQKMKGWMISNASLFCLVVTSFGISSKLVYSV